MELKPPEGYFKNIEKEKVSVEMRDSIRRERRKEHCKGERGVRLEIIWISGK